MAYRAFAFERNGSLATSWRIWAVMPAVTLVSLFVWEKVASDRPILQETWLKLGAIALVTATWFVIGMILAVLAGAHPLGRALVLGLCLSAGVGIVGGAFLLEIGAKPVRLDPQPTRFAFSESVKQSTVVQAVDGPAAGVHFIVEGSAWRRASSRDPIRLARGNVYRGRYNLWFAKLD